MEGPLTKNRMDDFGGKIATLVPTDKKIHLYFLTGADSKIGDNKLYFRVLGEPGKKC